MGLSYKKIKEKCKDYFEDRVIIDNPTIYYASSIRKEKLSFAKDSMFIKIPRDVGFRLGKRLFGNTNTGIRLIIVDLDNIKKKP